MTHIGYMLLFTRRYLNGDFQSEGDMAEQVASFSSRLNEAMALRNKKQADLIRSTGLSKQQLSQYVRGHFTAKLPALHILAEALDVNEVWLMGYDVHMKRETTVSTTNETEKIYQKISFYQTDIEKGTGEWLIEGHEYDFVRLPYIPVGADFAVKVRGDSMEPLYSNGEVVLVKSEVLVESGQIGVFCLNGVGYLKMLQGDKLVSFNKKYKPVVIDEFDRFICAGRVVGTFEKPSE